MPKERYCNTCACLFISNNNRARCDLCRKSKPKCPHGTHKGRNISNSSDIII